MGAARGRRASERRGAIKCSLTQPRTESSTTRRGRRWSASRWGTRTAPKPPLPEASSHQGLPGVRSPSPAIPDRKGQAAGRCERPSGPPRSGWCRATPEPAAGSPDHTFRPSPPHHLSPPHFSSHATSPTMPPHPNSPPRHPLTLTTEPPPHRQSVRHVVRSRPARCRHRRPPFVRPL